MPNGRLEDCLHSTNCSLNIFGSLNIMIDVASALEYLHFNHSTPIIHCDLKPSNVLLDENIVAHLRFWNWKALNWRQINDTNRNTCHNWLYGTRFALKQYFFFLGFHLHFPNYYFSMILLS